MNFDQLLRCVSLPLAVGPLTQDVMDHLKIKYVWFRLPTTLITYVS